MVLPPRPQIRVLMGTVASAEGYRAYAKVAVLT